MKSLQRLKHCELRSRVYAGSSRRRITIASGSKAQVLNASKQIRDALRFGPQAAGEHLSEGLYFIDREPLRAFFTIDVADMLVEIVNVKRL